MNRKQKSVFPEMGTVHKGGPKRGNQFGPDLEERFRVEFGPETTEPQLRFYGVHGSYYPTEFRAMIVSTSVWEMWYFAHETYTKSGQQIAVADDERFLHIRNPANGQLIVRQGEPFTPYAPGDFYEYERHGKTYRAKLRPYGRLYLFLPELQTPNVLTLKTHAFYDRINIEKQLGAIQGLANALNKGNAAGIPIRVFRRKGWVTWNKPEGGAIRTEKWLVNIEPTKAWMEMAMRQLTNFASFGTSFEPQEILLDTPPELDDDLPDVDKAFPPDEPAE
jgi:hypothetical protein